MTLDETSLPITNVYKDYKGITQKSGYFFIIINVATKKKSIRFQLVDVLISIYRPPGSYYEFLQEFEDFLLNPVVSVEKAVIVGDLEIPWYNDYTRNLKQPTQKLE